MSVPVVALFTVKEGYEDKVHEMFCSVIAETLREEGCITYQLNQDAENPRRFVWTEEWASAELLQKHLNADHIAKLFSELPPYIERSEVVALKKMAGGKA
ncbi:putative quinol monooxygenase [Pantoea endophytica]|uniref:putative quinol monooxygenase n=1 Tax=Pantoea endophytica TaxID=92488 RepID=UPI002897BE47|nr:putative quinol monooxygenase [Pantoea endophytica]